MDIVYGRGLILDRNLLRLVLLLICRNLHEHLLFSIRNISFSLCRRGGEVGCLVLLGIFLSIR